MKYLKTPYLKFSTLLFICSGHSVLWAADTTQQSEDEWKFTLKNAYINRDFDNDALKDTGSWSQAASLFYKSKMHDTPLVIADKPITIGADASVQYAVRLSSDKHVADTVLPFNKETQSQASDYLKYGATLKLGYDKTLLSVGELWLDLPVTAVDASRQLLASYWGTNLKSQLSDQLYAEIGRVEKVSPRNEEDFKKFSFTSNGITKESDGLNYIDLRYQFTPSLKERKEDILYLANSFLEKYRKTLNDLPNILQKAFLSYSWPGNIRELENIVERINVLLQLDHEILTPEFLKQQLPELFQSQNHHTTQPLLKEVKVNQELSLIEQTLAEVEGDLDLAAQKLGISRTTLWRRMKLINH